MKFITTLASTAVALAGVCACQAELANGVNAVVHDSVVTYFEVNLRSEQTADVLLRQYRNDPAMLEKKLNETKAENLEALIQRQLIIHEFSTAGYKLPETLLDDIVQERIKADFGDRATLTKTLEARGISFEKFRQQIRDRFIVEQLRLKHISQEIIISPHKVEAYYLAHRDDFKVEDEVKLRMIVLDKPASGDPEQSRHLAEEILSKLKDGAPFSEMAGVYSQESKRSQGGDWGWVEKSVLRRELADAAFSLKAGQRSGIIETDKNLYLMQVEDVRPAHFKALGEVRQQIERNLLLDERNRLEKQWVDRLKKKTFVRYF